MLMVGSPPETMTLRCKGHPWVSPDSRSSWLEPTSRRFVMVTAPSESGSCPFLVTELRHYVLVPNLGRHQERLPAEGLSAFIVGCLIAKLAKHHPTASSVNRSKGAGDCRDESSHPECSDPSFPFCTLPRAMPLREEQRHGLQYFQTWRSGYK